MKVTVIGGGLAGAEAAWQIARQGVPVELWEMRPLVMTPVHRTGDLAELVCSNSLRSNALENGVGLLKEELRRLGSLIMRCADATRIPAGKALAVDRHLFSRAVTEAIEGEPLISLRRGEVKEIPRPGVVVVASGPLTSPQLAEEIRRWTGEEYLYFYDAVAPIVDGSSVDYRRTFWGSRYGRGQTAQEGDDEAGDYLNCPLTEEEYNRFWEALVSAEVVPLAEHDRGIFFEGCLPVEEIARRGRETLLYGPLKPVGLRDPRTGERPYAVVQLRRENTPGTTFNLVGFQTRLKWGEQERVFRLIPALAQAEFLRFGVIHRNTYINSPRLLTPAYSLRQYPEVFFAGQITGVEGYVESAAAGLVAGLNAARRARREEPLVFPLETMIGGLAHYISSAQPEHFQPMNANFGLLPPLTGSRLRKGAKKRALAERALQVLAEWANCMKIRN